MGEVTRRDGFKVMVYSNDHDPLTSTSFPLTPKFASSWTMSVRLSKSRVRLSARRFVKPVNSLLNIEMRA
jgi:hypothetical protein